MSQQIDDKILDRAYWYNRNAIVIRRLARGVAIGIVVFIVLNLLVQSVRVLSKWSATQSAYDTVSDARITNDNISGQAALQTHSVNSVTGAEPGTVDAYARLINTNPEDDIEVIYTLTVGGETRPSVSATIPANSTYYAVERGFTNTIDTEPTFTLEQEIIHPTERNRTYQIDVTTAELTRLTTLVETDSGGSGDRSGASSALNDNRQQDDENDEAASDFVRPEDVEDEPTQRTDERYTAVTAEIFNSSPVGYRTVPAVAVITNSDGIVLGVHSELIRNLDSFEERTIQLVWERRFPIDAVVNVYVYPHYIDESTLIFPGE